MRRLPSVVLTLVVLNFAAALDAAESYQFTFRPAQVGDESQQWVTLNLDLSVAIKKDGALVDSSRRRLARKQQRTTTVLEVNANGPSKVKVNYRLAEKGLAADEEPVTASAQAVAGKTYVVARVGQELKITTEAGAAPTPEESETIAHDLATLGQPNPIGLYFHGKTFAVGEQIQLPNDLAKQLLGFTDTVGEVTHFSMTFTGVKQIAGAPVGVFNTEFDAKSTQAGTMSMKIRGQMLLDIDSCLAVVVQLSGPVSMVEARGAGAGQYTLDTNGNLSLAAQSSRNERK